MSRSRATLRDQERRDKEGRDKMRRNLPVLSGHLGLVCLTFSEQCRFRTITRTRYLALPARGRESALQELYWCNLQRLQWTLRFCANQRIRLYRMISSMFPMSDTATGVRTLTGMSAMLSAVGRRLMTLDMRMILHPDQFVVLNSESAKVRRTSITIMEKHALAFDLMGLPQTPWAAMILHGGKSGRGEELIRIIGDLPATIRDRLVLENDEYAYGAAEILNICQRAKVPMVFDNHHHAIKEKLDDYEHPSFREMVLAARDTWPDPSWQIVHLSNGHGAFRDRAHSHLIERSPAAFADVPWIEVEAKGKECAIAGLRKDGHE